MGLKERREKEKDDMRNSILKAAYEIVKEEGEKNLSIRKIAKKIDYSPAIVYHYFNDKEDIINQIILFGYQKILKAVSFEKHPAGDAEEVFKQGLQKYAETAFSMADEYKNIMVNDSEKIVKKTSMLYKGVSSDKKAIKMLCGGIKEISGRNKMDEESAELTAQVIWASMFGLIIRLIVEKDIEESQKKKLIDREIDLIIKGIKYEKQI